MNLPVEEPSYGGSMMRDTIFETNKVSSMQVDDISPFSKSPSIGPTVTTSWFNCAEEVTSNYIKSKSILFTIEL